MFLFLVPCSFFRWKVTNSPGFIHLSRLPSPASLAKQSLLPRPPPVWHALPRGLGGARRRAWCGCGWDSFQVMPETGPQTTGMVEDVKEAAKVAKPERSIWKLNQSGTIERLKWACTQLQAVLGKPLTKTTNSTLVENPFPPKTL